MTDSLRPHIPPPNAIEAEMAALGAMLIDPKVIPEVRAIVPDPTMFSDARHVHVCRALYETARDGPLDLVLLKQRLEDLGVLDEAGGTQYLLQLTTDVPTAANASRYANLVAEKHHAKLLLLACQEGAFQIGRGEPAPNVANTLRAKLDSLSIHAPLGRGRARIEFNPVSLTDLGESTPPEWVWTGYFARGHITLFTALWKSGKSTLLAHVMRGLERGGSLVAHAPGTKVLVVSEESPLIWRIRREEVGLGQNVQVALRPFMTKPDQHLWLDLIRRTADFVRNNDIDLVVIDTISSCWPVRDENDSGEVGAAIMPLWEIAELGAAVVLVHHPKKGDAGEAQASRGSGALPGAVDIIVEMRRFAPEKPHDTRRVLRGYSRFEDTPVESVLELGPDGYTVIGDRAGASALERADQIAAILPKAGPGWTVDQISENWRSEMKPSGRSLQEDLRAGAGTRWQREGEGKKGSAFTYWCPRTFDPRTPTPDSARNESDPSENGRAM